MVAPWNLDRITGTRRPGACIRKDLPVQCPNDQATLVMSERSGIEIDYCPVCRGVWLDRGELDKIVERASAGPAPIPAPGVPSQQPLPGAGYPQPGYAPGMAVPRNGYASPRSPGSPSSWDKQAGRGYGQQYGQPGYGQQYGQQQHGRGGKRRGNWLSELFD